MACDAAMELKKMGGARVILGTAPSGKAISGIFGGLARSGQMIIVAAPQDMIQIHPGMLFGGGTLGGSVGGSIEEALNFSALTRITPMVEVFPLEKAAEAYEKMISSKVLFRSVLKINP
jgi:D-arabinose 1-dehydrogenase-like Zn-dependent alcohol dehydrogenase